MQCVRVRLLYDRFQVTWATTLTVCIWPTPVESLTIPFGKERPTAVIRVCYRVSQPSF
jgi:hypothetical protein